MAQDPDRWVVTPPPNRAQAPRAAQQSAAPADDRWVVTPPPSRAPRPRANAPARGRQAPAALQDAPLPDEPIYAPTPNLPQTQEKREVTLPDGRPIVVVGEGAPLDRVAGGVLPDDYVEGDRVWRATPAVAGASVPAPMDQGQGNIAAAINVLPGPARRLAGGYAGVARGLARVGGGAYGLLGQAADRLGLDGIGNAMIDQANAFQGGADRLNAPFRNAALRENQIGQLAGEVAATVPLTAGLGAGVGAVGRGVAAVAPRTGGVISRVGQSITAGGFTPATVGRPVAGAVAPTLGSRAGNLAVRGVGGATAGGVGAAVIDEDDATMGAAIGAALPTIAARPAKWALNRVLDTYQRMEGTLGQARAATIVRNALGIDLDRAVTALRNAAPDVTAQQALVDAGVEPAAFMAVGSAARAADPDAYLAIEAAQAAARQAPIDRLAGGTNLTAAQLAARGEKDALRAATVPMQQAELAAADASNALDVAPVVSQLMQMADAPGVGTTNARVLAEVAGALDAMAARRGGVPSAEDIYAFRKDDLDDIITRALSAGRGGEVTSQAARRSEMVRATQDMLDSAIEQAGGAGWRNYLANYASGMRGIERQQMMGVAGRQLRQSPNEFANLVGGENPSTVEGVFGPGRIDLNAMMNPTGVGPSGMDALTRAAREVRRDERVGVLAREGSARARELTGPQRDPLRRAKNIAAWGRPVSAAAMDFGAALMDANLPAQTKRALAQAYQSGANMEQLLRMVPLADRAQVARNLMNPRFWQHLQTGVANTMASPDQPSNAMTSTYTTPEELANSVPVDFPPE